MYYVNEIYLKSNLEIKNKILYTQAIIHLYATIYDLTQLFKSGFDYFLDVWNYSDQMHIWGGYLMIFFQIRYDGEDGKAPRVPEC